MKTIKNLEKIYAISSEWKPSDLAFIKRFEWSNNGLNIIFLGQLRKKNVIWPDLSQDLFEISFAFEGVANLKLDFAASGMHQISGFDIIDISANGWENINFQIEDYENGTISFDCKDVIIESVR